MATPSGSKGPSRAERRENVGQVFWIVLASAGIGALAATGQWKGAAVAIGVAIVYAAAAYAGSVWRQRRH